MPRYLTAQLQARACAICGSQQAQGWLLRTVPKCISARWMYLLQPDFPRPAPACVRGASAGGKSFAFQMPPLCLLL